MYVEKKLFQFFCTSQCSNWIYAWRISKNWCQQNILKVAIINWEFDSQIWVTTTIFKYVENKFFEIYGRVRHKMTEQMHKWFFMDHVLKSTKNVLVKTKGRKTRIHYQIHQIHCAANINVLIVLALFNASGKCTF